MAETPYQDLSTQDILSAHISGLQHDINKLQEILNLNTQEVTGHTLNPVNDQQDPALRYRIYEGSIRGWLQDPAPVIYRNGSQVDSNEYEIQEAYGVIVFNEQQNADDNITADITHIISDSNTINNIQSDINSNSESISNMQNDIQGLNSDVNDLENTVQRIEYKPLDPNTRSVIVNVYPNYSVDDLVFSTDVLQAGDTIDAFPIMVEEDITINELMVYISGANSSSYTMNLGIYTNADAKPHELLGSTGNFSSIAGEQMYQSLESPVVLNKGVYWLARYQSGGVYIHGHDLDENINITINADSNINGSGTVIGVRTLAGEVDVVNNGLPSAFPPVGNGSEYLARTSYGTVHAVR